ncbi:hypothetical protein RIF29_21925 [Crotalaria pallida]|uniref:Uncharacterized protein n=1 Tax=Crotalaria pallida TaxID=3830 RepID=A0AAN9F3G9_CROPI
MLCKIYLLFQHKAVLQSRLFLMFAMMSLDYLDLNGAVGAYHVVCFHMISRNPVVYANVLTSNLDSSNNHAVSVMCPQTILSFTFDFEAKIYSVI